MKRHLILRVATKVLIPPILLYALYVQFHGDYGPGGGFQAGVIFASAFILYALIFGLDSAEKVSPPEVIRSLIPAGFLLYATVGVIALLNGGNFLDYDALLEDPHAAQHLGINVIEFGVGTTVAATIITILSRIAGAGAAGDALGEEMEPGDPEKRGGHDDA